MVSDIQKKVQVFCQLHQQQRKQAAAIPVVNDRAELRKDKARLVVSDESFTQAKNHTTRNRHYSTTSKATQKQVPGGYPAVEFGSFQALMDPNASSDNRGDSSDEEYYPNT